MISSTYSEGLPEADGRRLVAERHVLDDGVVVEFSWLGSQDAGIVIAERAAELQRQYDERAAARAIVAGTRLPLSPLEFLRRFPPAKRIAIRAAAVNDPIIADFLDLLNRATAVVLDDADTITGLGYLVASGYISEADRAVIES